MKIKILRYDPESKKAGYDVFEVEPEPGMTVLDALFVIQNTLDDSLAFRYACRGAVCGSCAMLINKVPRLACRSQTARLLDGTGHVELKPYPAVEDGEAWDEQEEVLVEPLPHLPPVNAKSKGYLGPAALAKLYRFHLDTREAPDDSRLLQANDSSGWWGCEFHANCRRVCPKEVPPNLGIGAARRRLTEIGKAPPEFTKGK
jgi:succinate dehydrogenase/fumarate reductase-like Fe-S protein